MAARSGLNPARTMWAAALPSPCPWTLPTSMHDLTAVLAQVISELQAERDRVQLLYDLSRQLAGDLDMPQALRGMLNLGLAGVAGAAGGARGSILLLDEEGRPTDWILIRDLPRLAQNWVVEEVLRAGLSGWIVQHGDIALVVDC